MALPLTPLARQQGKPQPDSAILNGTPAERKARPLHARGGQKAPDPAAMKILDEESAEAEEALAEALRMSLEENGGQAAAAPTGGDEGDDDLAEAIAMSMAQQQQQEQPTPAAAAPETGSDAQPSDMKQLVKELFEEFRRQGLSPNDAAVKAMEEAKTRRGSVSVASTPSSGGRMKQLVQELFEEYRKSGMAPNDAAAKAMQDAKARLNSDN